MTKKTFDLMEKTTDELKWFNYRQNNSGGYFVKDDDVSINVVVQAHDLNEANSIAESRAGIYFDGCAKGWDCNCCGDRWSEPWDEDGMKDFSLSYWTPKKGRNTKNYDNLEDWAEATSRVEDWAKVGESTVILYYYNGPKVVYYKD